MAHRSPARFLAPIALVAFALALFVVVTSSQVSGGGSSSTPNATDEQPAAQGDGETGRDDGKLGPRFYRVKDGDTPSSIAEKTSTPLEQIEKLNPDIDPQTLTVGDRIRLRR